MIFEQPVGCGAHASVTARQPCVTETTKVLNIQPSPLDRDRPKVQIEHYLNLFI
jgi:hypothetical protein